MNRIVLSNLKIENFEVAGIALNGATNAGLLALQILGTSDPIIFKKMEAYKNELQEKVGQSNKSLKK